MSIFFPIRFVYIPFTLAAMAVTIVHFGVSWSVFMALLAMSHGQFGMSNCAPIGILFSGHGFEVGRINAARNPAKVIELESFRNRANMQFVRNSMGYSDGCSVRHLSVISSSDATSPQPASRIRLRRDLFHQSFKYTEFSHVPSFKAHRSGLRSVDALLRPDCYRTREAA